MALCPAGRDDPNAIGTVGTSHADENTSAHANKIDALLSIVLAIINLLHGERISKGRDCFMESDAVSPLVRGRLFFIPPELEGHITTGNQ